MTEKPENEKQPEKPEGPILSPFSPRPRLKMVQIEMHKHGPARHWIYEVTAYFGLCAVFIASAAIAFSAGGVIGILGSISFAAIVGAGVMAILESFEPKAPEHMQHGNLNDMPPELREVFEQLAKAGKK